MKKAIIILLFLILVLIVSGCDQVDITKVTKEDVNKVIACEKPYIRFASGCCLDKDDNKICDKDESVQTSTSTDDKEHYETPEPVKEENIDETPVKEPPKDSPKSEGVNLASYPYFIDSDENIDFVIVVGDNAPQSDVIGAADIATSLQFASRVKNFQATINLDTKLSGEVSYPFSQHLIVIGNPCINPTSAKILGNPKNCTEGFEEGKAIIKIFEQPSGNIALLVAGYSDMDTRRASRVLADYAKWQEKGVLKGMEVEVTGTSFIDITVSAPAPKPVPAPAAPAAPAENLNCNLKIAEIDDTSQICYGGSGTTGYIEMRLDNLDETNDIKGLSVSVQGENNIYNNDSINSTIPVGLSTFLNLSYSYTSYGKVRKVRIVPKVLIGGILTQCGGSPLEKSASEIRNCTS